MPINNHYCLLGSFKSVFMRNGKTVLTLLRQLNKILVLLYHFSLENSIKIAQITRNSSLGGWPKPPSLNFPPFELLRIRSGSGGTFGPALSPLRPYPHSVYSPLIQTPIPVKSHFIGQAGFSPLTHILLTGFCLLLLKHVAQSLSYKFSIIWPV